MCFHIGTQLLMIPYKNKMLDASSQGSKQVSLQHLTSLLHNDNSWGHLLNELVIDASPGDGHTNDFFTAQNLCVLKGCQLVQLFGQTVKLFK